MLGFECKSPYLKEAARLADVIAALQVMGTYKFYKLDFAGWADRICGQKTEAEHWKKVFIEHPEFFRLDVSKNKASLAWRRTHQKLYNVNTEEKVTREDFDKLNEDEKKRISRSPLSSDEISALMNISVELHSRALAHQKEQRWWVTAVVTLVVAGIGFVA
ncbi:MAG: N-carbamoyl-L-amino acid amidohydrolase [Gammaproteobacteria bacterium]|nr:N-carbamoyl-L-amino acid amidohydrolase [Gammaproteobacteria bacterium]